MELVHNTSVTNLEKKSDRMDAMVRELAAAGPPSSLDPCYTGYFTCFNAGQYYEAHDVLEHLWLKQKSAPVAPFYQGLIQFAGGYVHLRKQYEHPAHAKHGRRLRPAARLFALAQFNLTPFAPAFAELDVSGVIAECSRICGELAKSDFTRNPWNPSELPVLHLGLPAY